jgi:restriction system protein
VGRRAACTTRHDRHVTTPLLPKYHELILPTLRAVEALGGSGSITEIEEMVLSNEGYSDEQLAILHNNGPRTEIGYRLAWARSYLKSMGLLTNSARGVWALTDAGVQFMSDTSMTDAARTARLDELRIKSRATTRAAKAALRSEDDIDAAPDEVGDWKEQLVATLTSPEFQPASFERLAQRLLREADFESVTVTGRSGDQGIDGVGIYRLGLITFPVFFQCKRYAGTVDPHQVRDFRGAMAGRGEKGLLITTGRFTAEAKREANRDGATPIELIDGDKLCDLLKKYELGVVSTVRQVEDITIDPEFFADL